MVEWTFLAIDTAYVVFGILALTRTLKDWTKNKNRLLMAISVYIIAVILRSFIDIAGYVADINIDFIVVGYLPFGQVLGAILFITQVEFVLFLKNLKKFYTLPVLISFYIAFGRVLVDNIMPFIIYAMIVSYSSAFILIRDGRKTQNGLAVGMGLFFLLWGLGQTIGPRTPLIFIGFRLSAMIALFLGTRGIYEKYIWPNQILEHKIKNTWIAKLVIKE